MAAGDAMRALRQMRLDEKNPIPGEVNTENVNTNPVSRLGQRFSDSVHNQGVRSPESFSIINLLKGLWRAPRYDNPVKPRIPGSEEPLY